MAVPVQKRLQGWTDRKDRRASNMKNSLPRSNGQCPDVHMLLLKWLEEMSTVELTNIGSENNSFVVQSLFGKQYLEFRIKLKYAYFISNES